MKYMVAVLKAAGWAVMLGVIWFALAYACAGALSLPVRGISMFAGLCIVCISVSLTFQAKICPRSWMNLVLVAAAFGVFMLLTTYRDFFFEPLSSATINYFLQ